MGILVARGELPPRWKTMARRMRASVDQRGKQPGLVEGRIDANQSWEIKIVRNSLRDKLSLSLRSRFPHRFSFPSSNEDFAPLLWPDDLDVAYREKREEKKGKEKEKGKKRADHERRDDESLEWMRKKSVTRKFLERRDYREIIKCEKRGRKRHAFIGNNIVREGWRDLSGKRRGKEGVRIGRYSLVGQWWE